MKTATAKRRGRDPLGKPGVIDIAPIEAAE